MKSLFVLKRGFDSHLNFFALKIHLNESIIAESIANVKFTFTASFGGVRESFLCKFILQRVTVTPVSWDVAVESVYVEHHSTSLSTVVQLS